MPDETPRDRPITEPSGIADWTSIVRARLDTLNLTADVESTLVDEVAQHLDDLYRELRSGGMSVTEAFAKTSAELDDLHPLDASITRAQRLPRVEPILIGDARAGRIGADLLGDFRYAARTLRANPVFALVVILTLGLGIGANTTVFTLIDTLLFDPLPVDRPSDLLAI